MILTHEPIDRILRTGTASHSQLGQGLIGLIAERLGMGITAVYHTSGTELEIPPKERIEKLIKKQKIQFVRSSILTVWCHSAEIGEGSEALLKNRIYDIFQELLRKENTEIDYPRVYVPEEMRYYGWINKKIEDRETSKVIALNEHVEEKHIVNIEFIDHLALWHALEGALKAMNRCSVITDIGARVLCGFNENRGNMAFYIILPPHASDAVDKSRLLREFTVTALDLLKPNDRWNAVNEYTVSPIICKWEDLSDAQKWSLAKG